MEPFSRKQLNVIAFRNKYDPKIIVLHGAIRSGKTYLALWLWWRHVMDFYGQGKLFVMSGYTMGSLERNVLKPLNDTFGIDTTTLSRKNSFKMYGNEICCFGSKDVDDFKSMRGNTSHGWLCNEATLQHPNTIREAIKRCSGDGARIIMDTNPSWPKHKIKVDHIDHSGEMLDSGRMKVRAFHFILDDNPFLSAEYIQMVKETTQPGHEYDRDILGKWVAASGVVWPRFKEDIHVIKKIPSIKKWYGGVDFGFENPFVYLLAGTDSDDRLYIVKEHYKSHMLIKDHAEIIKDYNNGFSVDIVSDHGAQERAELHACGVVTNAAQKDIIPGIQAVAKRLRVQEDGRPRLYIHEDCKNTIREFGIYSWQEPKEGVKQAEVPIDVDDHTCDTVRYITQQVDNRPVIFG
jgi:PBSX family phage terminase large subunit